MLKKFTLLTGLALTTPLFLWVNGVAVAEEAKPPARLIVYKPPLVAGRPAQRIGGGSRGGEESASVVVMAPEHIGQTIKAQPEFYWLTSRTGNKPVYFTLVHADLQKALEHPQPLLKVEVTPKKDGLQKLSLADHKLSLEPNVVYGWSVTVAADAKQHSKNVIASGTIKRVPDEVSKQLTNASQQEYPFVYANAGLWYDAFNTLTALIDAQPGDSFLKLQRVELLKQVGLDRAVTI